MEEVGSITRKLRHQEWARDVSERISSGLSVKEWCRQNNLSVDTYRSRLRTIRREMLDVVPGDFVEIRQPQQLPAAEDTAAPDTTGQISIEINGAVIRFDSDTPENLVTTAVKAVRNA